MKKIIITLLSLVMVFTFCACGSTAQGDEQYGDYTVEDLQDEAERLASTVVTLPADQAVLLSEQYAKQSQVTSGVEAEQYKIFSVLISDWAKAEPELGEFLGFSDFSVDKTGKTLTTTLTMAFTNRDAKLLTTYKTYNMQISSININPVYTLGETMKKAGLNTVMGLCIVFSVLILISLIISSFKLINKAQKKSEEKKKKAVEEKKDVPAAPAAPAVSGGSEEEVAAAIAAAICAAEETGIPTDSLVVRSVVRRY